MQDSLPTVLVVEDDSILQALYKERFEEAGLVVLQAFDGLQALDLLDQHPETGVLLVDLMLPKLSGYEVIHRIREKALTHDVPIVVVSALADVQSRKAGLKAGANEYITKGEVMPGEIIERVCRFARAKQGSAD